MENPPIAGNYIIHFWIANGENAKSNHDEIPLHDITHFLEWLKWKLTDRQYYGWEWRQSNCSLLFCWYECKCSGHSEKS